VRFSYALGTYHRYKGLGEVVRAAMLAEELGFYGIALAEHLLIPEHDRQAFGATWQEPLMVAAAVAAATRRIRIRTNVLVLPYHHPVRLAKQIASLDELSGGRITLGVGTGWMEWEFRQLGADWERRGAYTDEALRLIYALWSEDIAAFQGEFFRLSEAVAYPKPVQKPRPPVWIGGMGGRSRRRAVEFGDGWQPMVRPLAQLKADIVDLHRRLDAAGRPRESMEVGISLDYGVPSAADRRAREHAGGDRPEPIAGSLDEQLALIEAHAAAGVTEIVVGPAGSTIPEVQEGARRFAAEILPRYAAGG
jgi:probable F420-dependent oxidoreductase